MSDTIEAEARAKAHEYVIGECRVLDGLKEFHSQKCDSLTEYVRGVRETAEALHVDRARLAVQLATAGKALKERAEVEACMPEALLACAAEIERASSPSGSTPPTFETMVQRVGPLPTTGLAGRRRP